MMMGGLSEESGGVAAELASFRYNLCLPLSTSEPHSSC
jgi:hypothetical protein